MHISAASWDLLVLSWVSRDERGKQDGDSAYLLVHAGGRGVEEGDRCRVTTRNFCAWANSLKLCLGKEIWKSLYLLREEGTDIGPSGRDPRMI